MEKYLYDDLYEVEDKHWWHVAKRNSSIAFVNKYLKKSAKRILDLGCGTGKMMESLEKFGRVWGVDISSSAVSYCKQRGLKNVFVGSSYNLPFNSDYFDLVTIFDVLEHTDEEKTLAEVRKVLKSDGTLVLTVPAFSWLWSQWDVVLHHRKRYDKKSLTNVLENNGFKILHCTYMFSFLILPIVFVRAFKSLFFKTNYGSDFRVSVGILNSFFIWMSALERFFVIRFSVPFGSTLICVARKKLNS